jgi:hypothetical protein
MWFRTDLLENSLVHKLESLKFGSSIIIKEASNMRDVTQGRLLLALSFIMMVFYFWALFLAPQDVEFLGRTISDWALLVPVMMIVFLFLVVVAWIGWAMATTPPPIPLSGKESRDNDEKEKKGTV